MSSKTETVNFKDLLRTAGILPIAVFYNKDDACKIGELLLKNSIDILEITLRTEAAFECIKEAIRRFPELTVGAGSVLTKDALKKAVDTGAAFTVGPTLDMEIVEYAMAGGINFTPGVATPSELHTALRSGLDIIKIFPASNLGGPGYIKAVSAPFRTMDFHLIPTGGVNEGNLPEYLKEDRVIACGATYIVKENLIKKGDFIEIENRIKRAGNIVTRSGR